MTWSTSELPYSNISAAHVWSVFWWMSYFLPLRFPYQFLPLLLLGLSVKVEKSTWEVWVESRLSFSWSDCPGDSWFSLICMRTEACLVLRNLVQEERKTRKKDYCNINNDIKVVVCAIAGPHKRSEAFILSVMMLVQIIFAYFALKSNTIVHLCMVINIFWYLLFVFILIQIILVWAQHLWQNYNYAYLPAHLFVHVWSKAVLCLSRCRCQWLNTQRPHAPWITVITGPQPLPHLFNQFIFSLWHLIIHLPLQSEQFLPIPLLPSLSQAVCSTFFRSYACIKFNHSEKLTDWGVSRWH